MINNKAVSKTSESIKIVKKIDEVIDAHGGWPGAFKISNVQ
jgi:hypothetical protein